MIIKEASVIWDEGAVGLTEVSLVIGIGSCNRLTNFIFIIIVGNLDKNFYYHLIKGSTNFSDNHNLGRQTED